MSVRRLMRERRIGGTRPDGLAGIELEGWHVVQRALLVVLRPDRWKCLRRYRRQVAEISVLLLIMSVLPVSELEAVGRCSWNTLCGPI